MSTSGWTISRSAHTVRGVVTARTDLTVEVIRVQLRGWEGPNGLVVGLYHIANLLKDAHVVCGIELVLRSTKLRNIHVTNVYLYYIIIVNPPTHT